MNEKIACKNFKEVRARLKANNDTVVLNYALDGVPVDGFYVLRFWPEGRHRGEPHDFIIGELEAGEGEAGDFPAWQVPGITAKRELEYNIDIDVFANEEAYRENAESLGQCDRGGKVTLEPPPPPPPNPPTDPKCNDRNHVSFLTGDGCFEGHRGVATATASVSADHFTGKVVLIDISQNQMLREIRVGATCGKPFRETLTWRGPCPPGMRLYLRGFDEDGSKVLDRKIRRC